MAKAEVMQAVPASRPVALTGSYLKAFFKEAEASKAEGRLTELCKLIAAAEVSTVKEACKELTADLKKGMADYAKQHTRASEVRTLFGAVKFAKLNVTAGYHESIRQAREALKVANIDWQGRPKPSKLEREQAKAREVEAEALKFALAERDAKLNKGEEVTPEEVNAIREQAKAELEKASAVKLAKAIVKRYGLKYAAIVADEIVNALAADDAAEDDATVDEAQVA